MTDFLERVENLLRAMLPGVLFAYSAESVLPHLVEFVEIGGEKAVDALGHALGVIVNDEAKLIFLDKTGNFAAASDEHRATIREVTHNFDRHLQVMIGGV